MMAAAIKVVKKLPDPPKVKSIVITSRCRFRPSRDPEYIHTTTYEWNVSVGIKNPGDSNPVDEDKTMPVIRFVIFHPHPDFGLPTQKAPYRFEAVGYKPHTMPIEIHFFGESTATMINFKVRFEGSDIKKENKKWRYYEEEHNKIFTDFSDDFYKKLIQSNLVQSPRASLSPPDTTSPTSVPSSPATAGGAPINSKHPAMRRSVAKTDPSKKSSLSQVIVYAEEESSDDESNKSVDYGDMASSISSSIFHSGGVSGNKKQSNPSGKIDIGKKSLIISSNNKKHNRDNTSIDNSDSSNAEAKREHVEKVTATVTQESKSNNSRATSNGVILSSGVKSEVSLSSNEYHTSDASKTINGRSSSSTPKSSTPQSTAKRKRSLDEEHSVINHQTKCARSKTPPPLSTKMKKQSSSRDNSQEIDIVQEDRIFHDDDGVSFTLDDLLDRIERMNLEGKPVVDLMCIVKRAKDSHEGVIFSFNASFDFDLDTLPETAIVEIWSVLNKVQQTRSSLPKEL